MSSPLIGTWERESDTWQGSSSAQKRTTAIHSCPKTDNRLGMRLNPLRPKRRKPTACWELTLGQCQGANQRHAGLFHRSRLALNMPMEAMMKYWPYVWRRFKGRFKTRLLILGAVLAVFLLIRFGLGGL